MPTGPRPLGPVGHANAIVPDRPSDGGREDWKDGRSWSGRSLDGTETQSGERSEPANSSSLTPSRNDITK
jgi:hypothetical protein